MFLECTVAVNCLHYHFCENVIKSHDVLAMYSSGNLPIL
jgi:hypothetical protein